MRTKLRRSKRDSPTRAVSVLGNLLLLLVTIGIGVLVAYLINNPPGVVEASGARVSLPTTAPSTTTVAPTSSAAATSSAPANLASSCAAVTPLLDQAETTLTTAVDDPGSLSAEGISALSASLQAALGTAPPQLRDPTLPLSQVLIDLNSSVLGGEDPPQVDATTGNDSIAAARAVCTG